MTCLKPGLGYKYHTFGEGWQ